MHRNLVAAAEVHEIAEAGTTELHAVVEDRRIERREEVVEIEDEVSKVEDGHV